MILDKNTPGISLVKVFRKETGEALSLVTGIDTEKRTIRYLKVKDAYREAIDPVRRTIDDYEEVEESLDLYKVDGLILPSDFGYKSPWVSGEKNEAFWREVLLDKTIMDVFFDEKGVSALKLDDGQIVHLDTSGYRLSIKD